MALYDTVLNVVSDAAVEIGLGSVSAVFASTDPNVVQLRTILKRLGRRLTLKRQWKQLVLEHTFTTDVSTTYDLPADYGTMIDQTGWGRTSQQPMAPLSPQQWQYNEAHSSSNALAVLFRPRDLTLELPTSHISGQEIAFEYVSRYWVALTGTTTPAKDAPTLDTDVLLFDSMLLVGALKLAFKKAKGFDVTSDTQDFLEEWGLVDSANAGPAPVLSLNRGGLSEKLLDMTNAPSTGFAFDGTGGLF